MEMFAHQLDRLESHREKKTERQQRQTDLEPRRAVVRKRAVAHREGLAGAGPEGLSPWRCISAISAWSLLAAATLSRLRTIASPMALYCGASAITCWRALASA